jgi:hypothetical protein
VKKILAAYGFWAAGVLTAVAAAWLLYRSRVLSDELLDPTLAEVVRQVEELGLD